MVFSQELFAFDPAAPVSSGADRLAAYPTATGTSFLEAFQSCRFMNPGAKRRISASRLACPGRISS